jgi:sRNA-binding protein
MSKKFYGLKIYDYETAVIFIQQLQEVFPLAFPKKPKDKVPLMIGISEQLAIEFKIDKKIINNSLKLWCWGGRYRLALSVVGADRLDLYGNKSGFVLDGQQRPGINNKNKVV